MLRPGSLGWLLWWDLRLAWRGYQTRFSRGSRPLGALRLGFNLLVLLAFLHGLGWGIVTMVRMGHPSEPAQLLLLSLVLGVTLFTGIGISLATAINLLFVRNDLDLLCATPVSTRQVFAARSLSIALQAIAVSAPLLLPTANIAVLLDGPRWLAVYPMTLAVGLVATAAGLGLTILLVRGIGPRRARTVALVLSMLLGASFFLTIQGPNLLGGERKQQLYRFLRQWLQTSPLAAPDSWIWLPARAARGEAGPLGLSLVAAALLFALAAWLLPRGFGFALRHAAGMVEGSNSRAVRAQPFGTQLWRLVFLKEWRLIYRDPQLLVLLLQQLIGVIPAVVILTRRGGGFSEAARQGTQVCVATVVAGLLAATLVWLAVCAEDMPELLACAPRQRGQLRRLKLLVMLLPVWLAALALSAWVAWPQPRLFLTLLLCIAGCTLSTGVYNLWLPTAGSRKDVRRRLRDSSVPLERRVASASILFGWAGFAWCLGSAHLLAAALVLPLALAGPLYAWLRRDDDPALSY